jgi:hypothetical protein
MMAGMEPRIHDPVPVSCIAEYLTGPMRTVGCRAAAALALHPAGVAAGLHPPTTAPVVDRIFAGYLAGRGMASIARAG